MAPSADDDPADADASSSVASVAAALHAVLLAAAREVVGPVAATTVLSRPAARVDATQAASSLAPQTDAADFKSRAATVLFKALAATAGRESDAEEEKDRAAPRGECRAFIAESDDGTAAGLTLWLTTPMGVRKRRAYADARALADALVEAMEPRALASRVADVRVTPGGELRFTTVARLVAARREGLLACRVCAWLCAGDRGLREHTQVRHARTYEDALSAVADNRNALVASAASATTTTHAAAAAAADDDDDAEPSSWRDKRAAASKAMTHPGLLACARGDLREVARLVNEDGWDPKSDVEGVGVDARGSCALHWAAGEGHVDIVRYLVDVVGEDPRRAQTKRDRRGAMHWAARNGRVDVMRWLTNAARVDADAPTTDGTTPFMLATWKGGSIAMRWLVDDAGVDPTALNVFGCNAAQWAAMNGDVEALELLAELGVDVGVLNRNGHSALHKAATKGRRGACEWLIDVAGLGLKHMRADADGNTPAEMARLEGYAELASWLSARRTELAAAAGD